MVEQNVRLVACDLVRTRFAGRADMERAARQSEVGLVRLEMRLGLATEADLLAAERADADRRLRESVLRLPRVSPDRPSDWRYGDGPQLGPWLPCRPEERLLALTIEERERVAARSYAIGGGYADIADSVAPRQVAAIRRVRAERAARRQGVDTIATRLPEYAARTIAARRLRELLAVAGYRTATHSHETLVRRVECGAESAASGTGSASPQSVGLPDAYARRAYSVTTSTHTWCVSRAILSSEVRALNEAAPRGVVYLRADLRVRQGRGTSLTVQHRTGVRGAWS
jgi:hypothetical protein